VHEIALLAGIACQQNTSYKHCLLPCFMIYDTCCCTAKQAALWVVDLAGQTSLYLYLLGMRMSGCMLLAPVNE
jgi:hypothetical protein